MSLILPGNVASATASTGYDVANSCRFNDGDSAYMHVTRGSAGNQKTFTVSMWIKRCELGASNYFFTVGPDGDTNFVIYFDSADRLEVWQYSSAAYQFRLKPTRVFRDVSAWYHLCVAIDTTDATADDRVKIYINGVQETTMTTRTNPSEDLDTVMNDDRKYWLGKYVDSSNYFDGYIAELVVIDGSALAPTSFGEFDSDSPTIWKPIDVSGLTFGTNGFYLDFEDSANLGNDANGGTDWTEVNLAATDQMTDTPTNNFCTVNSLDNYHQQATFSEGNCKITFKGATSVYAYSTGTFGVANGKWYWETKATSAGNHDNYGIVGRFAYAYSTLIGRNTDNYGYYNYNGKYTNAATDGTYREVDFSGGNVTWTTGDIIGIALDLDSGTNTVKFYKNNALTGTIDIIAPSTGFYYPAWNQVDNQAEVAEVNFGNPAFTISSGNADENGYGNFEYAPPSGYLALCTKNLAEEG